MQSQPPASEASKGAASKAGGGGPVGSCYAGESSEGISHLSGRGHSIPPPPPNPTYLLYTPGLLCWQPTLSSCFAAEGRKKQHPSYPLPAAAKLGWGSKQRVVTAYTWLC